MSSSTTVAMKEEEKKQRNERHNKIALVIASLQRHEISSKEVEEGTVRRFLRARDMDVETATAMLLKYLKWRTQSVLNGSICPSQVPNEIAQNKMFMQGSDKQGRPTALLFAARHFLNNHNPDEFKRFVVCVLDKICSRYMHLGM